MKVKEIAQAVKESFKAPQPAPSASATKVSEPEPPAPHDLVLARPTPELNPRNRALKEIAARANADADAAAAETMPSIDEDGNITEPASASEPQEQPQAEPAAEPQESAVESQKAASAEPQPAPAAATPGIDPNAEYEFIVDGNPVKFKGSQVISRVQKGEAADYRLNLATKMLEEASRQAQSGALPAQGAQPQPTPSQQPEQQLSDAQLAEMVQFGSPEHAAKAVAEIRRRDPQAVTQEGLRSYLRDQLPAIVQSELAFNEATRFVQSEYGDLLSDPYLKQLFFVEENRLRKAGDQRAYIDLYRAIGDGLRTHFNRPKQGASAPAALPTKSAAPTLQERQERKQNAPAAPKLASARLEGGSQTPKPKTREEIIERMRQGRGQHQRI